MFLNTVIDKIKGGGFFNTVEFRKDLENIDNDEKRGKLKLPACFLLPVQAKGQTPVSGNTIRQERVTEYHFLLIGEVKDDEEFIDEAINELKKCVFGLQVTPHHHPMWFTEGRIHDLNSKLFYWQEGYATSLLNKQHLLLTSN